MRGPRNYRISSGRSSIEGRARGNRGDYCSGADGIGCRLRRSLAEFSRRVIFARAAFQPSAAQFTRCIFDFTASSIILTDAVPRGARYFLLAGRALFTAVRPPRNFWRFRAGRGVDRSGWTAGICLDGSEKIRGFGGKGLRAIDVDVEGDPLVESGGDRWVI